MRIQKPSDFKIRIESVKDIEGHDIDVASVYLLFVIIDKYGHRYEAISDPNGTDTKNTEIVEGVLYVAVENTKLEGCLLMSTGIRQADTTFPDGYCTTFSKFQPINVEYV